MTSLPHGWVRTTLGEVTTSEIDRTGPEGAREFLYVDISSVDNGAKRISSPKRLLVTEAPTRARQRLSPGDVLVSMTRPNLNAVAIVPENMNGAIGSTGFHVLRAAEIDPLWLYYLVQTNDFVNKMSDSVQGVVYPAVRPKDIEGCEVPLAPLGEQRRVVAEIEKQFTRLDAGVAALERVRMNLERYRASVLKAACEGRLVPTEAELSRREGRDYESGAMVLQRISELRELTMQGAGRGASKTFARRGPLAGEEGKQRPESDTAELWRLPEGWAWARLIDIAELKGGITKGQKRGPKEAAKSRLVPYLRVANVQRGFLDLDEIKRIEATPDEIAELRLRAGDVLFNEGGDRDKLGRGWVWQDEIEECIYQNHIFRARLFLPEMEGKFISMYGNSLAQPYFLRHGKQTTNLATINQAKLGRLPVPIPPVEEQRRIVRDAERLLSGLSQLERASHSELRRAGRLRQSILRSAYAGKLVQQDPTDEPAVELIARIRRKPSATVEAGGGSPQLAPSSSEVGK